MTSITNELPNFPQVSQLHSPTVDGYPDESARWNCVPASLAAGVRFLTGRVVDPDELKDAVYGQGYVGAQAAREYVQYLHGLGVALAPWDNSSGATLVAAIHTQLAGGHPVVATIPSQWGTPDADPLHPSGSTHVVCFYGWGPAGLRAMNPWIAPTPHDGDDSYWAPRLCFGEVWAMSRIEAPPVSIDTTGLGAGDATEAQAEHSSVDRPETYIGTQGHSIATLKDGTGLYWDGSTVHPIANAAAAFDLLLTDRDALLAQLTEVKAQLAAAQQTAQQQPAADVQAATVDLQQLEQTVQQIVADVLAKLGGK